VRQPPLFEGGSLIRLYNYRTEMYPDGFREEVGQYTKKAYWKIVRKAIHSLKRTSWIHFPYFHTTMYLLNLQTTLFPSSRILHERQPTVARSWSDSNAHLLAPDPRSSVILSCDEADFTILNYCKAKDPNVIAVVLSSDSDFNFLAAGDDITYTINYRRFWKPAARQNAHNQYVVTDNRRLHASDVFPWKTNASRHLAAIMAGVDYLPGGLASVGLWRLADNKEMASVSG